MGSWLDDSQHPLHVMKFAASYEYETLDAEFTDFQEFYRRMVQSRPQERIVLLADLSRVNRTNARNRKRIAKAVQDLADLMQHRCLGQAYVVRNPVILAALTAVTWIKPTPWPTKVFRDRALAETWLKELMPSEPEAT